MGWQDHQWQGLRRDCWPVRAMAEWGLPVINAPGGPHAAVPLETAVTALSTKSRFSSVWQVAEGRITRESFLRPGPHPLTLPLLWPRSPHHQCVTHRLG
jgi:hypothetical protein